MLTQYLKRALLFERDAHTILAIHESAPSRLILLEDTYKKLGVLSVRQDELFRQALRCIENELFRAAHVMAWAGFMDYLEDKIASDGLKQLRSIRTNWKVGNIEELRENYPEYQLIEAAKDLGLCSRTEMKGLHGLLNKRNECAHPSDYFPLLNESLGYISEILQRVAHLQPKIIIK